MWPDNILLVHSWFGKRHRKMCRSNEITSGMWRWMLCMVYTFRYAYCIDMFVSFCCTSFCFGFSTWFNTASYIYLSIYIFGCYIPVKLGTVSLISSPLKISVRMLFYVFCIGHLKGTMPHGLKQIYQQPSWRSTNWPLSSNKHNKRNRRMCCCPIFSPL